VTVLYAPGFDRTRIAALAPVVLAAAAEDPDAAQQVLEPAGDALAEIVIAVARTLGWSGGEVPLALAGTFLLGAAPVSNALEAGLARCGYAINATPVAEPVRGALILAGRAFDEERNPR